MTWTGQNFNVGQVLTAAQMNNLQSDITAAFNKDAGAPVLANDYITNLMMGDDIVGDRVINWSVSPWSNLFANGTTNFPAGLYIVAGMNGTSAVKIEVWNDGNGTWATYADYSASDNKPVTIFSEAGSTQFRVNNTSGSGKTMFGFKLD